MTRLQRREDHFADITVGGNLSLSSTSKVEGNLIPDSDDTRTLGDASHKFSVVYATSISGVSTAISSSREILDTDFTLTGWGAGAAMSSLAGYDEAHEYTITAGTSPSDNPTIVFANIDGAMARAPITGAWIIGGTGTAIHLDVAKATTGYTATYNSKPVATKTYKIMARQVVIA